MKCARCDVDVLPGSRRAVCAACEAEQVRLREEVRGRSVPEIDAIAREAARDEMWSMFAACMDELDSRGIPPAA